MTGRHRALIVEDDPRIVEELEEVLKSLTCDSIIADNKLDALTKLQSNAVCFILLDLEIKLEPGSIKGHTEHGNSLLREIRRTHPEHTGLCYWLPILIVSGFAREVPVAVEVMKDGADDLIQKPFKGREVSDRVRRALERSGRVTHDLCSRGPASRPLSAGGAIVLSIPGDRVRRRIIVKVGSKSIDLPRSSLKVLLHLMVAHEQHTHVHKRDLGATDDQGFKGVSVLKAELKHVLGDDNDIITNDHHGNYGLREGVTISGCDADKLALSEDKEITELARNLQRLVGSRRRKSDGNS